MDKKSNATSPKPSGTTPTFTVDNTPRHKLMKMGKDAGMVGKGAPTRP